MLANTAMLVNVRFRRIATSRKDASTTDFVLQSQHAEAEAGHWTSKLWPKEALAQVQNVDSRIRAFYHQKTLPWTDSGQRILAAKIYTGFIDQMRTLRYEREDAVRAFLDQYEAWVDRARQFRGNAFDADQYPSRQKAGKRFHFSVEVLPLPSVEDFRINVRDSELVRLQEELTERITTAEAAAKRDLFARIAAPVADLLNKLTDPDAKLTEATFNAIRAMTLSIPEINLWEDPAIEALRDQLDKLSDLHAENLKCCARN